MGFDFMLEEGKPYRVKGGHGIGPIRDWDTVVALETSSHAWCVKVDDYVPGKTWLDYVDAVPFRVDEVELPFEDKPNTRRERKSWISMFLAWLHFHQ